MINFAFLANWGNYQDVSKVGFLSTSLERMSASGQPFKSRQLCNVDKHGYMETHVDMGTLSRRAWENGMIYRRADQFLWHMQGACSHTRALFIPPHKIRLPFCDQKEVHFSFELRQICSRCRATAPAPCHCPSVCNLAHSTVVHNTTGVGVGIQRDS